MPLDPKTTRKLGKHLGKLMVFTAEKMSKIPEHGKEFAACVEAELLDAWKMKKTPQERDPLWLMVKQVRAWQ